MLIATIPVLFVSLGWFLQESANQLSSVVLFFISLVLLFQINIFDKKYRKIGIAAFSIPLAYLISALVNNVDLRVAWVGTLGRQYGIGTFLALAIIFVASVVLTKEKERVLNVGLGLTIFLAIIYGTIQIAGIDPMPWNNPFPGISLSLGNPNFAGALLGMLIVVPFVWSLKTVKSLEKIGCYGLLAIIALLGYKTYSIQFFALASINIAIFTYLNLDNNSRSKGLLRIVTPLGAIAGLFLLLNKNETLLAKIRDSFVINANVNQRLDFWRTGIGIWKDYPIFGVGPDQFQNYAGVHRTAEQLVRDGAMILPDKAHNVFIDYLANAGLIGGILWLASTLYISFIILRLNKTLKVRNERMYCAAFSSIWFAYIAQSLISPDQIILTSLGYISAGLVFGVYLNSRSGDESQNHPKKKVSFNTLAVPSILLVLALIFYGQYLFYSAESRKVLLSEITEPSQILETLDGWPNPGGLESLAVGLSQNSSNCVFVQGLTQRLIKLNDRSSQAWFVDGGCSYSQGNYEKANAQVTNALKFDPLNTTYLMGQFQIQLMLNNIREAQKTLDLVKRINPSTNGLAKMEEELSTLK